MPQQYRTAAIVNPASASGRTGREWPRTLEHLRAKLGEVQIFQTQRPRHAIELTRHALHEGFDRILSVGGDGTHFEVTNGFFEADGSPITQEAHVCFLPRGTGSDFTRSLHIPRDLDQQIALAAEGAVHHLDLIRLELAGVDGKPAAYYFQNIARAGIGAEVVRRANEGSRMFGGFATFMSATIAALFSYRPKPVRIELDGRVVAQPTMEVVVAQGRFDGGGMRTAPHALLDDGFADCYLYGSIGLVDALVNVRKIVSGTMLDRPDVVQYQQAKSISVSSSERIWVEADGELLGQLPARFEVVPKVLRVVTGEGFEPLS
ncbi:MAG: YegS/Rv2252/BmrU family lipid kinase [Candidatus Hydrogenedens sp.]|nr:YegS/Rv2252/BmrU family lipid kinase [Candidatus Hydrogenedens sp.]